MPYEELRPWIGKALDFIHEWEASWGAFRVHPAQEVDLDTLTEAFGRYARRLTDNYPFFHPRYAGQMLKPPHPVAVLGYFTAMLINPNNHALDGGPATGKMEKEVVRQLAAMFHFPEHTLGHLTGGGTIANLEALWVSRELHPQKAIAFSREAHYTHERMCRVIQAEGVKIPTDRYGRMDLDALEEALQTGRIGTVVLTAGTTGPGAVDPIDEAVSLCRKYEARVHVDAAYGGFFSILAWAEDPLLHGAPFRAIAECDSVAVDPHKHGLQPYGCGCILFRDPSVGQLYKHDSPYTYFTSTELHLGEISLECSRPGAAAGALWLTLQCLPLEAYTGLGPILRASLHAARRWASLIERSEELVLYLKPELDIVTYYPRRATAHAVDAASQRLFEYAMKAEDPVFLSVYRAQAARMKVTNPRLNVDQEEVRILRSVLMKPEHELYVEWLHQRVVDMARAIQQEEGTADGKEKTRKDAGN